MVMAKKEKVKLTAEKRKVTGRKVKTLRQEGILPINVYGKGIKSLAAQLELKFFLPVYQKVGETGIVELKLTNESKARPVLIHNVQLDPVSDQPLHADFYQVDLKKKVSTEVPVELVGESPAAKEKLGILIQLLNEVEVEALPTELPEKLELDISGLKKVGDAVVVADLKVPKEVKVLTPEKEILAKIEPLAKEEEVAPPPTEEGAEEEKAEGEEEEEGKAEGEKKAPEEGKAPSKEEPVKGGPPEKKAEKKKKKSK